MRCPLVALALLLAAATARADLVLAPGEPFTAQSAKLLLEPLAGGDQGIEVLAPVLPLNNRSTKPVHLAVAAFHRDEPTGNFTAEIVVRVGDEPGNTMQVSGRAAMMIEVSVLSEPVQAGTILAAAQVVTARVPASGVPGDALTAPEIIGTETVRRLGAGRPLRIADVREPVLVRRGEAVALMLESGSLRLSALGKALEDGVKGAPVRVLNLDSKREVRGIVVDRKQVAVQTGLPSR